MLNVKQSAKDVLLKSPILKKAVNEGKLTIISAVYKLESGEVARLD
jgi:carbonic anhydrase